MERLPATALTWTVILHHCPSNCHTHPVTTFVGAASGSFVAPDHEYPSHLELQLTARDSTGLTDTKSVLVLPQTALLSFQTNPTGLQLAVGGTSQATPFTRTVILGLDEHHQRDHAADPERDDLRIRLLVRRRRPEPQHRGQCAGDLHRDVRGRRSPPSPPV